MQLRSTVGILGELEQVVPHTLTSTFLTLALVLGTAFVACVGRANVQCEENANCDLSTAGLCVAATTGNKWCAYPDHSCSSGYKYSPDDVGDGVGGTCTDEGVTLRLMVGGSGTGTVTAMPTGFLCSSGTCTGTFPRGTQVQLTAMATAGAFLGWSDACQGPGACVLTMDQDQSVGALFGMPGQALWVRQLGGMLSSTQGKSIATDSASNVIAVGDFTKTTDSNGITLTSAGGEDFYAVKLNPSTGDVVWAKRFGGVRNDVASAVAVDSSNSVYITGFFEGDVDFGGGVVQSTAASSDAFLLKLTPNGDFAWVRTIGGSTFDNGLAVAVRANTVVIAGLYTGSMSVGGMTLTSAGSSDVFVQSLTTDGAPKWIQSLGGSADDSTSSVALDSAGNVVVTGAFATPFVAKLAAGTGAPLFSKPLARIIHALRAPGSGSGLEHVGERQMRRRSR